MEIRDASAPSTVADVLTPAMIAAVVAWPALVVGVVVVVALCLWALFRPGSIADRARHDDGEEGSGPHPSDGGT